MTCRCSYHPLCLGEATKAAERTLRQARGSGDLVEVAAADVGAMVSLK